MSNAGVCPLRFTTIRLLGEQSLGQKPIARAPPEGCDFRVVGRSRSGRCGRLAYLAGRPILCVFPDAAVGVFCLTNLTTTFRKPSAFRRLHRNVTRRQAITSMTLHVRGAFLLHYDFYDFS